MSLALSDEPYMHGNPFPNFNMSLRCGLSQTTPTPLKGETTKLTKTTEKKRKERRPIRKGQENVDESHRLLPARRAGRECVNGNAKPRRNSTNLARGGDEQLSRPKKKTQ